MENKTDHTDAKLLARLLDAGLDGMLAFDRECRYTAWNSAMERISGFRREAVVGRYAFDLFPFLKETGEDEYFYEALAGRSAVAAARRYTIPETGQRGFFDGYYSPLRDDAGEVVGGVAIIRDTTASREAGEALRASEERYRAFIANSSEGIWRFELERPVPAGLSEDEQIEFFYRHGYLAECNDAMARMYGFERAEEVVGARLGDLLVRDDPKNEEYLRAFIRSGYRLTDAESVEVDREGRRRFFSNNLVGVVEDGVTLRAWGTQRDVSERKRIEEELKATEHRFLMFMERLPGLAWIKDLDGRYVYVNEAAARAFGSPREELRGKTDEEIFPPETAARFRENDRLALSADEGVLTVETLEQDDGLHHSIVSKFPIPGRDGETSMVGGIAIDVTERMRAEAALRESEEKYRSLLENANDIIYSHDLEGNYLTVNRACAEITGYTREEILGGLNIAQVVVPEHLELAKRMTGQKLRDPSPTVYEVDIRTKDGRRLTLEVSTRIALREGHAPVVEGIGRDVTDRKRAEREREQLLAREHAARLQAEEASRLKDEFLATLSHELRTPLTAILGWAHMLRRAAPDEEMRARAAEVIERNAVAQRQLVEDILDVSRIITGRLRIDLRPVELIKVVEAAREAVQPAAEAKGITIESAYDADSISVSGDPDRLQQVVWNLLSNAVKFTPGGGRVSLRIARAGGAAEVAVSDTGEGIAPEFLPHVFDRFRQADMGTTRRHGGLGLGLSIVRHLVELHGGTVRAESAGEGRGSTFLINLPLPSEAEPQAPQSKVDEEGAREDEPDSSTPQTDETADQVPPRLVGLRVLLVDDDEDSLEMLSIFLRRYGAEVTAASSADAALDSLRRTSPDVIVSDIGMPEVDGNELIRRVRSLEAEQGGSTPAVALTAYAGDADRLRALSSGYQEHMAKPVEPEELVATVLRLATRGALRET